jgi:alanyl-tRNA synthetase
VSENTAGETRIMAIDDAMQSGAMALFGEKYGEEVRVVSMGRGGPPGGGGGKANKAWSVELCGGTHVRRTGDIGLIHVIAESASAAGVRRIEALTSEGAREYLAGQDARVKEIAGLLRVRPEDAAARVEALLEERKQLERQLADARRQAALGGGTGAKSNSPVRDVNGVKLLARTLKGIPAKDLRALVDDGKKEVRSGVAAIIGIGDDGRASIAVGVTGDLVGRLSAVELVRVGAEALGGKGGGGRPDLAQAGGPDGSKADAAIEAIAKAIGG